MKLSEAIRKGSKNTKKVKYAYAIANAKTGRIGATCALGAAFLATGHARIKNHELSIDDDVWRGQLFGRSNYINPVTKQPQDLFNLITDLNDEHGWSRKRIAAWVEKNADVEVQ